MSDNPFKNNSAKGVESFDVTVGNSLVSFFNRNVSNYPTEVGAPKFDLVPVTVSAWSKVPVTFVR